MTRKKNKKHGSEEKNEMKNDAEKEEDVIATIHVLKNKEQVEKKSSNSTQQK